MTQELRLRPRILSSSKFQTTLRSSESRTRRNPGFASRSPFQPGRSCRRNVGADAGEPVRRSVLREASAIGRRFEGSDCSIGLTIRGDDLIRPPRRCKGPPCCPISRWPEDYDSGAIGMDSIRRFLTPPAPARPSPMPQAPRPSNPAGCPKARRSPPPSRRRQKSPRPAPCVRRLRRGSSQHETSPHP